MADSRYFSKDGGLRALSAARAVADAGPIAYGSIDRRFWAWVDGVWGPGEDLVHARICRVLGEDYRTGHDAAVRGQLRAELPRIAGDPVPEMINFSNGLLEWSGELELVPHDARVLSTVQLPVSYRPGSMCVEFEAFLAASVAPDDIGRVWEVIGYLMMSGNPLQRAFLLTGPGGNGKGVLLEVIRALLGGENCTAVPLHDFAESRFVTAELFGRLANICGDIDATFIDNTSRIKEITGEDTVMGERKGQDPFYFKPWCKMIFSANEIPGSADSSTGWTRRFEIIEFPNKPAHPDRGLKSRLTAPASLRGIAVRAVDALRALMARGDFVRGDAGQQAHQRFAERSNKAYQWVSSEDCDYPNPSRWYTAKELYQAYQRWQREEDPAGRMLGRTTFYAKLRQVPGMNGTKRDGYDGFTGLVLTRDIAYGSVIDGESSMPETPLSELSTLDQMALDLGKDRSK